MKRIFIYFISAAILLAVSCDPLSIAYVGDDVNIDIDIRDVSKGFIDIEYKTNMPAYYLAGIQRLYGEVDLKDVEERFKLLALDSAYVEYVAWRHDHLALNEQYIADFASHSLNYSNSGELANFLIPDTDYLVYAFVVDREKNSPAGKLFWKKVHTLSESKFKNIRYKYRVRGSWDYVYPYDITTKALVTKVPWAGQTIDSLILRRDGYETPGLFFSETFATLDNNSPLIHLGVYAHYNNGLGDGSSYTWFERGHTYYTAMATIDGPDVIGYDIYKFTFTGEDMELEFDDSMNTQGEW